MEADVTLTGFLSMSLSEKEVFNFNIFCFGTLPTQYRKQTHYRGFKKQKNKQQVQENIKYFTPVDIRLDICLAAVVSSLVTLCGKKGIGE